MPVCVIRKFDKFSYLHERITFVIENLSKKICSCAGGFSLLIFIAGLSAAKTALKSATKVAPKMACVNRP